MATSSQTFRCADDMRLEDFDDAQARDAPALSEPLLLAMDEAHALSLRILVTADERNIVAKTVKSPPIPYVPSKVFP